MASTEHVTILKKGQAEWNRWREITNYLDVDLSGADLAGMKLNHFNLLRANLKNAILIRAQLENAHLTNADLTGATLASANLEHVNARDAIFDDILAENANFEVSTLRGARFRHAKLSGARFHRAYLRDADLRDSVLKGTWLRFATLDGAHCNNADFTDADLRHALLVKTDLRGATLLNVSVFGISAWSVETDSNTRQDLIVDAGRVGGEAPLRAHDLQTAQLLALMLDGAGVRRVLDSVSSKLVLILGSFSPSEKVVLDALRSGLQSRGYVAVTFDFQRPSERDYAETIVVLAGMSRFVIADFTNAKEVRSEVTQIKGQYKRVPIIPLGREGESLPITMANVFSPDELGYIVRYKSIEDLLAKLGPAIIDPAEKRATSIAESITQAERIIRGLPAQGPGSALT